MKPQNKKMVFWTLKSQNFEKVYKINVKSYTILKIVRRKYSCIRPKLSLPGNYYEFKQYVISISVSKNDRTGHCTAWAPSYWLGLCSRSKFRKWQI